MTLLQHRVSFSAALGLATLAAGTIVLTGCSDQRSATGRIAMAQADPAEPTKAARKPHEIALDLERRFKAAKIDLDDLKARPEFRDTPRVILTRAVCDAHGLDVELFNIARREVHARDHQRGQTSHETEAAAHSHAEERSVTVELREEASEAVGEVAEEATETRDDVRDAPVEVRDDTADAIEEARESIEAPAEDEVSEEAGFEAGEEVEAGDS